MLALFNRLSSDYGSEMLSYQKTPNTTTTSDFVALTYNVNFRSKTFFQILTRLI